MGFLVISPLHLFLIHILLVFLLLVSPSSSSCLSPLLLVVWPVFLLCSSCSSQPSSSSSSCSSRPSSLSPDLSSVSVSLSPSLSSSFRPLFVVALGCHFILVHRSVVIARPRTIGLHFLHNQRWRTRNTAQLTVTLDLRSKRVPLAACGLCRPPQPCFSFFRTGGWGLADRPSPSVWGLTDNRG